MSTSITKRKFILIWLGVLQIFVLGIIMTVKEGISYRNIAMIAIIQCISNIALLNTVISTPVICLPNMFSVFSLFFHCGQIIKEGFKIQGTVPLPFQYYADKDTILSACFFYLLSQSAYFIGLASVSGEMDFVVPDRWENINKIDFRQYGKVLLLLGIVPRLYIDVLSLLGALSQGYKGVYSLYFPQMIQSMAFFFDAGIILYLLGTKDKRKSRAILVAVLFYKCLMMTTGARQEKVAYLLVVFYLYFFVCNNITVKKILILAAGCVAGFAFVSAIGTVRTTDTSGFMGVLEFMRSGQMTDVFGSALGEFGSALDTLEVAVAYTPDYISYGYGRSYIAGALSVVPLLVNQMPLLSKTTIFVHQLPGSVYFALGGSYLGELFYNFSWLGILGCVAVGRLMGKLDRGVQLSNHGNTLYAAWCAVISTAMILFVRGYFTDMIQKLVWTYLVVNIVYSFAKRRI